MNRQDEIFSVPKEKMIKVQVVGRGITNEATVSAIKIVPRHLFVPVNNIDEAYNDNPLPIGYGQTISQPYIVALMTEVLKPDKTNKVLEIGTGSGYQAAILAEINNSVYTIEIIPELASESSVRLKKLGYNNIFTKFGDGYHGWPEHAPYDSIIVTAAIEKIPEALIEQLAEKGRMIIPVGLPDGIQELILVIKTERKTEEINISSVRFVPFKRLYQ
jgi:protein-L-isoaspartate(D-aspartate) O-methyltransferase